MPPSGNESSWKRNLAIIWTAQFICAVGFSFGLPFVPFFLQKDLHVPAEELTFWVSLFGAAQPFTMMVF